MKPNERNLERLLKKLIKQQQVSASDLLSHWKGLGEAGDRALVSTLNKQNGWEPFVMWSESEPQIREKLKSISDRPGISEAGLLVLRASGLIGAETETARSQSLWILQTIRNGESEVWQRAVHLMLQGDDFFYATLSLLELEESAPTALFFARLLDQKLSHEQDQAVRRSLYRLRQKGIEPPAREMPTAVIVEPQRSEIFLFAQNRLPLWQPFFYYRSTGSRGDWFFAEIAEGKTFEIIQQQRSIRMNQKRMREVANNYAIEFQKGTGVDMPFVLMPAGHARFFLARSLELVTGSEDFQKYMGEAPSENPFQAPVGTIDALTVDASVLLNHDFFKLWTAEEDLVDRLFEELQRIDEAPIILPEHQTRQRKAERMDQIVQEYFSNTKRSVWRLALEKAAYFLRDTEPEIASRAFQFASQFTADTIDYSANAFTKALVDRSIEIRKERMEREQQEQKRSSLIMSPQEFQRSIQDKK